MRTIEWIDNRIKLIDQSRLPAEEVYLYCDDWKCLADAIKTMKIRGAPALGAAAAMGIAIGAVKIKSDNKDYFKKELEHICEEIGKTRPTAVNLFWGINRMKNILNSIKDISIKEITQALIDEALKIAEEDISSNRAIGRYGVGLIEDGDNILTHCNAGGLATVEYGTALGVIRAANEEGKNIHVYVDETRPCLQGSRLTAWELTKEKIPMTLIADNMAGFLMKQKKIDKIIVGGDRIASNGDTANKIGTYSLSVLAKAHNLPFYVAAPLSSIDYSIKEGNEIIIEERSPDEVKTIGSIEISPKEVDVYNPAFDITPAENIEAIITDKGIAKYPYKQSLVRLKDL